MPKIVNIPGVGRVNFPDSMTDDQIINAIQSNILKQKPQNEPSSYSSNESSGYSDQLLEGLKDIPQNLGAMTRGAATSAINFPAQALNMVLPKNAQFQLLGNENNPAFKTGKILGDVGTFGGAGAIAKGSIEAAQSIPLINKLSELLKSPGIASTIARNSLPIAANAAGGATYGVIENPEDRAHGAELGGALSLAGSAMPAALSGLSNTAEYMNPLKYTKNLANSIKESYQTAKNEASSFFNPVSEKFGNEKIYESGVPASYKQLDKEIFKSYVDSGLRKMNKEFLDNPTFQKAHDLQSQLGVEIRAMQKGNPDAYTRGVISDLSDAREALKEDMNGFLQNKDPAAAQMYNIGSQIFSDKVAPYRSNPTINKIASGSKQSITPLQLKKSLTDVVESGKASPDHYLSKALEDLSSKIHKGKAASDIIPILGGGLLGGSVGIPHGITPGLAGASGGMLLGKFFGPSAFRLAQNPEIEKLAKNANPHYQNLIRALMGAILGSGRIQ